MIFPSFQLSKVSGLFSDFLSSDCKRRSTFLTSSSGNRLSGRIPRSKSVLRRLVVGDVLMRDFPLTVHLVLAGVEDRDFGCEVFGLEQNGGRKVGQWAAVGHFPLGFHGLGTFAKQGMVPFAADESKVLVAASLLVDDLREFFFCFGQFFACMDALSVQHALFYQLGFAGLHRKVGLGKSNFGFARVTVLRNQVARIACEHDVWYILGCTFGHSDRFVDVNKMIKRRMSRKLACGLGFADDKSKVAPFRVAQQVLYVPCQPILYASFRLLCMALKGVGEGLNQLFFHGESPVLSCLAWRTKHFQFPVEREVRIGRVENQFFNSKPRKVYFWDIGENALT